MIPEKPTVTTQDDWGMREDFVHIPLENGYRLDIDVTQGNPGRLLDVVLLNAQNTVIYRQPWRTDAIRNCMDAMVRNECATPKAS